MSNRLASKFVVEWIERFAPSLLSEREFNIETDFDIKICNRIELEHRCPSSNCNNLSCQVNLATQNHIKKGVFMETVIIINMYICVFVSLIYALF